MKKRRAEMTARTETMTQEGAVPAEKTFTGSLSYKTFIS